MKKFLSIITSIVLSVAIFVMPVSAAEVTSVERGDTITISSDASVYATSYWTKTTTELISINGEKSSVLTFSSGSVSGTEPKITKVEAYCIVSSGSDPFYLWIEDANGNAHCAVVSQSGTIITTAFNGLDPRGKWKVWIVTKETISIATITIKVYYTY